MHSKNHISNMELCSSVFHFEYNEEWPEAFENLEAWIVQNDDMLDTTKNGV